MFKVIFTSATSACFEMVNSSPYLAPQPYEVLLNGTKVLEGETNVFSLFGLQPGTSYDVTVKAGEETSHVSVTTRNERVACDVRDFGAKGDGQTDDTQAIQQAILMMPHGGRLVFPTGTYLTGPIFLKSHMSIELQRDAVLLGLTDKASYPVIRAQVPNLDGEEPLLNATFEGLPRDMYASLLTGEFVEDVTLIGPGRINGNAQNGTWWQTFQQDPVARPRLLFLNDCSDVTLHGVQVANSASWQLHPFMSNRISFYDVSVEAPKVSPNTDALDPDSCSGVTIVGCRFSVGDDCIAIKSGKLDMVKEYGAEPSKALVIRNCLMAYGHGAVTLGSEISGGLSDLEVNQCLFRHTDRGLRIKTRRGRGQSCDIDGVLFENIRMENVLTPIVINMWYNCVDPDGDSPYVQSREALPVDERTPHLGHFTFRDMDCEDVEVAACYADGLPEMPIDEVVLERIRFRYREDAQPDIPAMFKDAQPRCKAGLCFSQVRSVVLRDVRLEGVNGEPLELNRVDDVTQEGFEGG